MNKPLHWKSLKTGNKFDYNLYINHGKGGIYSNRRDLPADEYPYTLIYQEKEVIEWNYYQQEYKRIWFGGNKTINPGYIHKLQV